MEAQGLARASPARHSLALKLHYTIEEFKALKEKSVAKKPLNDGMRIPFSYYCPNCKEELSDDGYEPDEEYCCNCGQHILIKN